MSLVHVACLERGRRHRFAQLTGTAGSLQVFCSMRRAACGADVVPGALPGISVPTVWGWSSAGSGDYGVITLGARTSASTWLN